MKLDFYKPENELLKKYIEGYYFISKNGDANSISYFTFPNNYGILSVYQNAKVQFDNGKYCITSSEKENMTAELVMRYIEPIEVTYKELVNEITIYFKPLGINRFIHNSKIFEENIIEDFNPFSDFKITMEDIFNQPDRKKQIELLEEYWLSKFENKDLSTIENILKDIEANIKISEIADKNGYSRQHINKLIKKNLGKTPTEYRKIYRFRNCFTKYKDIENLTALSFENQFYDQSHFIKDFKSLANTNAFSFFKKVDTEKENVWLFI